MMPVRKVNGEHRDDMPTQPHQTEERRLPEDLPDILGEGFTMSRSRLPNTHEAEVLQLMLNISQSQEKLLAMANKGGKWLPTVVMGGIALAGMFGAAYMPRSQSVSERNEALAEARIQVLESQVKELNKLRTLYLIRFGEDPDTVDPSTMRKPTQRR